MTISYYLIVFAVMVVVTVDSSYQYLVYSRWWVAGLAYW